MWCGIRRSALFPLQIYKIADASLAFVDEKLHSASDFTPLTTICNSLDHSPVFLSSFILYLKTNLWEANIRSLNGQVIISHSRL